MPVVLTPEIAPPGPGPAPDGAGPGGWMRMTWERLLFAHWRVPKASLERLLPAGLELDLHEGEAWLGVVPFVMTGVGPAALPRWAGQSFPELNVRTYVRAGGLPGVWFFSLDAASPLAVRLARRFYHLPYFDAAIESAPAGEGARYHSSRTHAGAAAAELQVEYEPSGPPAPARPGSLEAFLVERYRLFAMDPQGRLFRGEIAHAPWPLQTASARITKNTMAASLGLDLAGRPELLHFAARLEVRAAWLRPA